MERKDLQSFRIKFNQFVKEVQALKGTAYKFDSKGNHSVNTLETMARDIHEKLYELAIQGQDLRDHLDQVVEFTG